MTHPEWLKKPPSGAVWVVEDTLTQLVRVGVDIGGPVMSGTVEMLNQAQAVHDNERLWRRVPATVNSMSRETLRNRLLSALNNCRGFN
ncbi:MAG TPA: hypothetical protein VJM46_00150 [Candidatus Saccharimonadales bacterium]|nr:hypothetical protein [Candidatus Saccharimonadales bacterium]